ncbi:MAG: CHASE3 domain-containing protein [Candidatus Saccharibacteria bacterium]|nr:CHASE3 domain-containing protein [Moraxellaceae bacterium]
MGECHVTNRYPRSSFKGLYFFALVLLLALAVPMYLSALNQVKFNDWVTHTHDVQNELQKILAEMTDAETADRGYVISDDLMI